MNIDQLNLANGLARKTAFAATGDDSTIRQFIGLIIEYVGSQASCLITCASNNAISSKVGAAGAEAADTNFTVGATPGTIDLTNASADTMGEVVDFINGLADYKARLACLRRADDADTVGALVAVTDQQAKVSGGLKLATDTSVCKHVSASISVLDGDIASGSVEGQVGSNSDFPRQAINELQRVDGTLTYSGASVFEIIEVDDVLKTDEVIYSNTIAAAIAASTSAGSFNPTSGGIGIQGRIGKRLIVRARAATSVAVTNFSVIAVIKAYN